jgi:hypothetical protein
LALLCELLVYKLFDVSIELFSDELSGLRRQELGLMQFTCNDVRCLLNDLSSLHAIQMISIEAFTDFLIQASVVGNVFARGLEQLKADVTLWDVFVPGAPGWTLSVLLVLLELLQGSFLGFLFKC